jgi:hypothetical protein
MNSEIQYGRRQQDHSLIRWWQIDVRVKGYLPHFMTVINYPLNEVLWWKGARAPPHPPGLWLSSL